MRREAAELLAGQEERNQTSANFFSGLFGNEPEEDPWRDRAKTRRTGFLGGRLVIKTWHLSCTNRGALCAKNRIEWKEKGKLKYKGWKVVVRIKTTMSWHLWNERRCRPQR